MCWFPGLLDIVGRTLLLSDRHMFSTRVLALNATTGHLASVVVWRRAAQDLGAHRVSEDPQLRPGARPDPAAPWYEDTTHLGDHKFMTAPDTLVYRGAWTFPYFSCHNRLWIMSYTVGIPPSPKHG